MRHVGGLDQRVQQRRRRIHRGDRVRGDGVEDRPGSRVLEQHVPPAGLENRQHETRRAMGQWRRDEIHVVRAELEEIADRVGLRVDAAERLHDRLRRAGAAAAELDDLRVLDVALDSLRHLRTPFRQQRPDRHRVVDDDRRMRRRDHRVQLGARVPRIERYPHFPRGVRRQKRDEMLDRVAQADRHAAPRCAVDVLERGGERGDERTELCVREVPLGGARHRHRAGIPDDAVVEPVNRLCHLLPRMRSDSLVRSPLGCQRRHTSWHTNWRWRRRPDHGHQHELPDPRAASRHGHRRRRAGGPRLRPRRARASPRQEDGQLRQSRRLPLLLRRRARHPRYALDDLSLQDTRRPAPASRVPDRSPSHRSPFPPARSTRGRSGFAVAASP